MSGGGSTFWTRGAAATVADLESTGGAPAYLPPLRSRVRLDVAVRRAVSPAETAAILAEVGIEDGWITRLAVAGSRVETFAAGPPGTGGMIVAGEGLRRRDSLRCRIGEDGDGGLAVWIYGFPETGAELAAPGFDAIGPIEDVLVERRSFVSVRKDVGRIDYDVVWQATAEFGLRPRLCLFAGFHS